MFVYAPICLTSREYLLSRSPNAVHWCILYANSPCSSYGSPLYKCTSIAMLRTLYRIHIQIFHASLPGRFQLLNVCVMCDVNGGCRPASKLLEYITKCDGKGTPLISFAINLYQYIDKLCTNINIHEHDQRGITESKRKRTTCGCDAGGGKRMRYGLRCYEHICGEYSLVCERRQPANRQSIPKLMWARKESIMLSGHGHTAQNVPTK